MKPKKFTPYERATFQRTYQQLAAMDPVTAVRTPAPLDKNGQLSITTAGQRLPYFFSIRRSIFPKTMPHVLQLLQRRSAPSGTRYLLMTDYLTDEAVNLVRATRDVDYVDEAGNMLLRWPRFYIDIRGRRRATPRGRARPLATAGGTRVIFALLAVRSLHNVVYRDLELLSGVTVGTISQTINQLRRHGLLERRSKTLVRLRASDLLELWISGYAQWLRPQLIVGHYRSAESLEALVQHLRRELPPEGWALTGGFAAEMMTRHYRGDTLGLFVRTWEPNRSQELRWLPDDHGPITVFRPFSDGLLMERRLLDEAPIVHPLLVYAELIFDGRERSREAAEQVRERYLGYLTDDAST